jgi:DNA-binding NarL/FixJ family response regulator
MKTTVFNADDHPILRKGVTDLLKESEGIQWVGSAKDGQEALDKIQNIRPDVAILDIEMPYLTGLEVAQKLIERNISTRFILLTLFKDEALLKKALTIGIKGYLLKESSETEILDCIKTVAKGEVYVNPNLAQYLSNHTIANNSLLDKLTKHEINILKLIAKQKTSSEIANMLFISPKTVSNHRNNISKKLDLSGEQNGLLKWAIQHEVELNGY